MKTEYSDTLEIGTLITVSWSMMNNASKIGVVLAPERTHHSLFYIILFPSGIERIGWSLITVIDDIQ